MTSADEHSAAASGGTLPRVAAWFAVIAWAGVIFWWSSKPGSQIPGRFSEAGHLVEYFVFGFLLYVALTRDLSRGQAAALAVVIASAYGVTDEFHQHFVVMRTPDVVDWGSDTVGAAAGALIAWAVAGWRERRRRLPSTSGEPGTAD